MKYGARRSRQLQQQLAHWLDQPRGVRMGMVRALSRGVGKTCLKRAARLRRPAESPTDLLRAAWHRAEQAKDRGDKLKLSIAGGEPSCRYPSAQYLFHGMNCQDATQSFDYIRRQCTWMRHQAVNSLYAPYHWRRLFRRGPAGRSPQRRISVAKSGALAYAKSDWIRQMVPMATALRLSRCARRIA